jgi:hypothetical protein
MHPAGTNRTFRTFYTSNTITIRLKILTGKYYDPKVIIHWTFMLFLAFICLYLLVFGYF